MMETININTIKFKNGVFIIIPSTYQNSINYYSIKNKEFKSEKVAFLKGLNNFNDIKFFNKVEVTNSYELIDKNKTYKTIISKDEYNSLSSFFKKEYQKTNDKSLQNEYIENIEFCVWLEFNFDYFEQKNDFKINFELSLPVEAFFRSSNLGSNSDKLDNIKHLFPCYISGENLYKYISDYFKNNDNYLKNREFEYRWSDELNAINVFESDYNGEMKRVEERKQNGGYYAKPRYKTVPDKPEKIATIHFNKKNTPTISGKNYEDLISKVNNFIKDITHGDLIIKSNLIYTI